MYTDDTIKRKNGLTGLNYVNLLSDRLSLDSRLYYTYNSTRFDYNYSNINQTYATQILKVRTPGEFNETSSNRYGLGIKLDWRASDQHRLIFGGDGNITDLSSSQYSDQILLKNTLADIQEKNAAAFVQDEWKIVDKLTALLSLRYDWSGINKNSVSYIYYSNPSGYSLFTGSYI